MNTDKQTVRVMIFGSEYVLKSDSPPEHMQRVATLVDQKMQEINKSGAIKSNMKLAILAALNIADEYYKTHVQAQQQVESVEQRIQSYIDLMDSALNEPGETEPANTDATESGTISLFTEPS
jgi:cell division protein ZapA